MKNHLIANALAIFLLMGTYIAHVEARQTESITITNIYAMIFSDFSRPELESDLIDLFEHNFTELITDIEKSATKQDLSKLVPFLRTEFSHYVDILPMKERNPEQFKEWINIKQKEYRSMILGRKIQKININPDKEKDARNYKSQLKSLLAEILEAKLTKERRDINQLEERLEKLKKIHQLRKKNKDKMLQNRFDELVGNRQLLQW